LVCHLDGVRLRISVRGTAGLDADLATCRGDPRARTSPDTRGGWSPGEWTKNAARTPDVQRLTDDAARATADAAEQRALVDAAQAEGGRRPAPRTPR